MILVLAVHAVVALAAAYFGPRLGRRVMLVGAIAPAVTFAWLLAVGGNVSDGGTVTEVVNWVPAIGLDMSFLLDGFSTLMVALVGGIGVLIFVYAWKYFDERAGLGRFASYLVLFAGSMFGLVVADNLLLLFVFWELTSITSYLLIGFEDENAAARAGALQALLVTGAGGLAMLGGIVLVAQQSGTYSLAGTLAAAPSNTAAGIGLLLILLGAFTKSAQFPFHFWLPGAMTAPTPVSAYLHSATMVKAGIYLVARLAPVFAVTFGWWRPVVVTVGLVTMLVGGWRALAQHDLKLILAQGTISQLGFIMVLVGIGLPEAAFAGMAMIIAHAIFKAALFMVAGIVDHQTHTRDIRRLSGVGRAMPATAVVALVATASMAGIPPLLGFITKEAALEALLHDAGIWAVAGVVIGSMLTVAYGLHFLVGGFADREVAEEDLVGRDAAPPAVGFLAAPAILVAITIVTGPVPSVFDGMVGLASEAVATSADLHLGIWHGFGMPLLLSGAAIAGGLALWLRPLRGLRGLTARLPEATRVYASTIGGLNRTADRVTSIVQSGSLPVYLGVILTTAVIAPGLLMVRHWTLPSGLLIAESPAQAVVAILVVIAAVGTVAVRRRLGAVLFLGAVGYGVAVLFVIQGAPDLALTQLLVETLTLGLFILVLRHLPARFESVEWRLGRLTRVAISVAVGLSAGMFALWTAAGRTAAPLVGEFLTRAEPEGGGLNVVNVILTDFRALDTMGEITVLTVVALGAMALIRARLDQEDLPEMGEPEGALRP